MGLAVVTVAAGGLPVVDVTAIAPRTGTPVTEAANGRGVAVTKVTGGKPGLPVVFETIGVAVPVATTFNPSDLSNITLSGGNLVATVPSGNGGVRGIASFTSGKYYLEYTYTTINTNVLGTGIALVSASLTGTPSTGIAYIARTTGQVTVNGVGQGSALGIINVGTVLGIAVDFTGKLVWFRFAPAGNWNNSGTANPATGVGGINITAISAGPCYPIFFGQGSDKVTANFGASAFSGAVPAGFTSGWLA